MPEDGAPLPAAGDGTPLHLRPFALALVFVGGTAGTLARFGLAELVPAPAGLPLGVLLINVTGAFALGVLLEALARRGADEGGRRTVRLLVGTGFLGGFTTYSALAVDAALLAGSGRTGEGIAYLVVSVLVGLAAAAAGVVVGRRFGARPVSRE
ncbi:CrcB family protein, partial [Vibrio cholerae]|nr:CrcB family protein [Vibrio cholerae]